MDFVELSPSPVGDAQQAILQVLATPKRALKGEARRRLDFGSSDEEILKQFDAVGKEVAKSPKLLQAMEEIIGEWQAWWHSKGIQHKNLRDFPIL